MKKRILTLLVILSLIVLVLRFGNNIVVQILGFNSKSGIKITAKPDALVFLNGQRVGTTPFQDEDLKPGEYDVQLSSDNGIWQGKVQLNTGTLSVVNRELSTSQASSSGEILTLAPGHGVIISSTPEGSNLEVDGKDQGKTPIAIPSLSGGEHTFLFSHEDYLERSVRATVADNMALSMSVDLAVSEADLASIATPSVMGETAMTVKQTPTGFLRVRDKPSLSGQEIAKIAPGEQLLMIENLGSWIYVKLPDGSSGYVSSAYLAK